MKYIIYDTRNKVYMGKRENVTGLGMRLWSYHKADAEHLTKSAIESALKVYTENRRKYFEIQEIEK